MLVEKVPDLANLTLASSVLGQFLGDAPFSLAVAVPGVGAWAAMMSLAFLLAGREPR
jgi:hypothetical protein